METKKRIVERRWKEAKSEQLQQEVAKTGIEKSTKKVQKRRPNAKAGRSFHGSFQFSSRTEQLEHKEARMEQLEHREAEMEQPENDGKQRCLWDFCMRNGGSYGALECYICTKTNMFDLTAFLLFGIKAVLEQAK